jgi:hypothetical protein
MQTNFKLILGSLTGAVFIQAAFIACGSGHARIGSTDGGPIASIMDAISEWVDSSNKDAMASDDAGTCGCSITLNGPAPTTPASENPAQLVQGNVSVTGAGGLILTSGPFVLTDAMPGSGMSLGSTGQSSTGAYLVAQSSAAKCPTIVQPEDVTGFLGPVLVVGATYVAIHGARYVVPAGQMLCAYPPYNGNGNVNVQWAGFRPY